MSDELRTHTVPLEDVQRIHLDLDQEDQMEFSEATIAAMLQSVANEVSEAKAAKIRGVVRALLGEDQHHRLELRLAKRGRHKMSHDYATERKRNQAWLEELAAFEREGLKTEAAIASIAEKWQASRASVFAGIRLAEQMLAMGRSVESVTGEHTSQYDNPRPAKNDLG